MSQQKQLIVRKAQTRLDVNLGMLAISFTVFTFVAATNPELFNSNQLLSIQLALTMPLFFGSIFARSKLIYAKNIAIWEKYGFLTFVLGYSMLINSVGIIIATISGKEVAYIFWGTCSAMALLYSALEVSENRDRLADRIKKDLLFIGLIVIFGIWPIFGQ